MTPIVQRVDEIEGLLLGEGPHWDAETQSLYFVDILGKSVHKYVPSTRKHTYAKLDKMVSFIIPVKGHLDRFVISMEREIVMITWDGVSSTPSKIETVATLDHTENNRINDAKVDPLGNLWAGTMAIDGDHTTGIPATGSLYHLGPDKQAKKHVSNICVSNGLAWSKDLKKMFYIDSAARRIDQFDYDSKTLSISNRQPLFTFEKHHIEGYPDGQTIDTDDNLWVAAVQGDKVIKIDTRKSETLLGIVNIPEHQVTSVAFGGSNLDELYVTTCGIEIAGSVLGKSRKGYVYKIADLGVKGLPGDRIIL